ncbi:MAG: glycosyltransferase [Chloroflexota bacterium]|nr:glycosyltransferase [Chloroflexota bacterium]MDQ5867438.1 glycosyltransferase [Chloroflexota bacterium]
MPHAEQTDRQAPSTTRLAHITASYLPDTGGIARYAHDLAACRPPGTCSVVAPAPGKRTQVEIKDGVRVIRVARQAVVHSEPTGIVPLGLGRTLRRLSGTCDLFHAHLPFPALLGLAPLAGRRVPWVVTYHNEIQGSLGIPGPVRAVHDFLLHRLLARSRSIIVTTASYARACPSLAAFQRKVRVVPYGLDAEAFTASIEHSAITRSDNTLLYVGRLAYYKGLDVLLKALRGLPNTRLIVVGEGPEGEELRKLSAQLGVHEQVEWRGRVSDTELPVLYSSVAAFVLPSTGLSESFGIVQLEAHACGTPVVSSNLPGVREVNPDGVSGLLAQPGDADDLSRKLKLLLGDPELRNKLGEQARRHVREQFPVRRMLAGVADVYREVLRERMSHN